MRIFRNKTFSRYARKEGITDDELRAIIPQLEENNSDANLGGDVFKMRVPRPGEGKSGGYRVFVYFRSGERTFFAHGLEKSESPNIKSNELEGLKTSAKYWLSLPEKQLVSLIKTGELTEITEE
jgi:hypothetical protein